MKWFSFCFSLYLLTLSCLPCKDSEHEHVGPSNSTSAYFATSNGMPAHSHCEDACSPFCGCQCCSVTCTFRAIEAFELWKPAIVEQKQGFAVSPIWLKGVSISIDHPPQFS